MKLTSESEHFLSRGIDYLGSLGMKLRDLRGHATLAFELVQNADDAPGVSCMRFDICDDALVVDNDGVFSDCGMMEASECPWKLDPEVGHRCDFHRFRRVAGADKRNEVGTVGAFGIGFTTVYQVTDRPELLSGPRHWILDETRSEAERIRVCPGCAACQAGDRPGTRFILPWALDAESPMRRALGAQAVESGTLDAFTKELTRCLPTALLFLNRLQSIEVLRDGQPLVRIAREVEGDLLVLDDGSGRPATWHLLRGDFAEVAARLRKRYPGRIEQKRSENVVIAIPEEGLDRGLFCAFLPTQHDTGLPFHIHADLFPTSDRKRIVFDQDFQAEWNQAAVEAAARALRDALSRLPGLLGHVALWKIIAATHVLAGEAESGRRERVLTVFWKSLAPELSRTALVFSTGDAWQRPSQIYLSDGEDPDAMDLFEAFGLPIVHRDLRYHFTLLRSREIGVNRLGPNHLSAALQHSGLTRRIEPQEWPVQLDAGRALPVLWREVGILLGKQGAHERKEAETLLSKCAIALGHDGALWPCTDLFRAPEETITLFGAIDPATIFLADLGEEGAAVVELCPTFTVGDAVDRLEAILMEEPFPAIHLSSLLRWFSARSDELTRDPNLRRRVAALPMFPSATGPRPLRELALPGDFVDPIGLADLVDVHAVGGCRELLGLLGARPLSFAPYIGTYLPKAFRDPATPSEKKDQTLHLVASRLEEIRDNTGLLEILRRVPLVACTDGEYRAPEQVYLPERIVRDILGNNVATAGLPRGQEALFRDLYGWLGVESEPRHADVVARVRAVTAFQPTEEAVETIRGIVRFLGERVKSKDQVARELIELRSLAWLPSQEAADRWHPPQAVHAVFQRYLFESQALFLDVPHTVQGASSAFLQFLGVQDKPTMQQVVEHLLAWSAAGIPVHRTVYRHLNDAPEHPAVSRLRGTACLLLPDNSYVRPDDVFWGEHSFGKYRHRLGPDLRGFGPLFTILGVREAPDHRDALAVLADIAALHGRGDVVRDEDTRRVLLHCWQTLDNALEAGRTTAGELRARLSGLCCIVHPSDRLLRPREVFFEDRAGLAVRFGPQVEDLSITRPQGAWRAMAAAGVQSMAATIRAHLVECDDPCEDRMLAERIRSRRHQLARVFESFEGADGLPSLSSLDSLRCAVVTQLKIQHVLDTHAGEVRSLAESVPAHFQHESETLYFVRTRGRTPWASLAREIALALRPEGEPGQLASGLKEVLAAESEAEANSLLDELGFPPLQLRMETTIEGGAVVMALGGEEPPTGITYDPPAPVCVPASDGLAKPEPGAPLAPAAAHPTTGPNRGAGNAKSGGNGGQPGPGTNGARSGRGEPGARPTTGTPRQDRLRSYVIPAREKPEGNLSASNGSEAAVHRATVDRAGVGYVLDHERSAGRLPEEMPPNHPGYDVISRGPTGEVLRYIEVKSISGPWGTRGAGLSSTQFREAYEGGAQFWLYVVEHATESACTIYRIQDPARRVDQFFYDDGWRVMAEGVGEEGEAPGVSMPSPA